MFKVDPKNIIGNDPCSIKAKESMGISMEGIAISPINNSLLGIGPTDKLNIKITNNGPSVATYRLFGGDTGLSPIEQNNYALGTTLINVGDEPNLMVYNPDLNYVYVLNNGNGVANGSISVIDSANNQVVNTVNLGVPGDFGNLVYVAFNKCLYIVKNPGNTLIVVNTLTYALSSITVGNDPVNLAYADNVQRIYVTNSADGTVTVINANTNTVVGSPIATGIEPFGIIYVSSSGYVYSVARGDSRIDVINPATNTVITTIPLGTLPTGILYSSTKNRIYVSNVISDSVSVINPATNTVVATVSVGPNPTFMVFNTDNSILYCINSADYTISTIDTNLNTVTGLITLGFGGDPGGQTMTFNTFDNYLYVALANYDVVQIFDTANNNVLVQNLTTGNAPAVILFNQQSSIYVSNIDSDDVFTVESALGVTIIVNGGITTIEQLNQITRFTPICFEKISFDSSDRNSLGNTLTYNKQTSAGAIESFNISLLQKFSAFNSRTVNNVVLENTDLPDCLFDGSHYLQNTIDPGVTLNFGITYKQLEIQDPFKGCDKKDKIIKKYSQAKFKFLKSN